MPETREKSTSKQSRTKLVLIPVLLLVLLVVVLWSSDEDSSDSEIAVVVDGPTPPQVSVDTTDSSKTNEKTRQQPIIWPVVPVTEILTHNPFELPPILRKELGIADLTLDGGSQDEEVSAVDELNERQKRLEELTRSVQDKKVNVFIQNERGTTAMIGTRVIREGDLWEEGVRIVEIKSDGVVLELVSD